MGQERFRGIANLQKYIKKAVEIKGTWKGNMKWSKQSLGNV